MEVYSLPSMVRSSVEEISDKIFVTEEFDQEFLFFSAQIAPGLWHEVFYHLLEQLLGVLNRLHISFLLEL
jgi:hypothetical protein